MDDKQMSILDHLDALRRALIVSILALIPGTAIGWYIRQPIMDILIRPVKSMHYKLVYIGATEAFMAEFKIAIFAGMILAMPVVAYQFWKFIVPALHSNERKYVALFVPISMVLFAIGIVFGYYTVFTYGIQFLLSFGGEGLTPMLSLGKYLSFAFWFLLPFGVMFELPLVILLLVRLGILSTKFLTSKRKWVLVASFVISAVATPTTDMLSQTVMAVAIYLLYEVSIWLSFLVKPKVRQKVEESTEEAAVETAVEKDAADEKEQAKFEDVTVADADVISEYNEEKETNEKTIDQTEELNNETKVEGAKVEGAKVEGAKVEGANAEDAEVEKSAVDEHDSTRLAEIYKEIIEQGQEDEKTVKKDKDKE